jgi:hypothetical protein
MAIWRCLLVLLCVGLPGCRPGQTGQVRIDPALATLVPHDTVTLAGIRMEALRDTPLYRKWVAERPLPAVDRFAEETGLDLRKDLWEALIASDGKDVVVMARGKFSATGEEPRIDRPGVQRMPYKGYTLIGTDEGAVVFLNQSTAAAGRPAVLRTLIDRRDASQRGVPPALMELVREIPAHNQVWVASLGGFGQIREAVPPEGALASIGKIFSLIEQFRAAADLRNGLDATASARCRNEQDAKTLHDALRGLVGLGRLSTPDNRPELLRVYDAMQVEQDQRAVRFRAEVPLDVIDTLMQKRK